MVKETMEAVRQAEGKAQDILKEAGEKAGAVLAKARMDAALFSERERASAGEVAARAMKTAEAEMADVSNLCRENVKKEVEVLKESAATREEQAIKAVLEDLY